MAESDALDGDDYGIGLEQEPEQEPGREPESKSDQDDPELEEQQRTEPEINDDLKALERDEDSGIDDDFDGLGEWNEGVFGCFGDIRSCASHLV